MSLILLTDRHAARISGVLSCFDRVIVQGTLPIFCYAEGMTSTCMLAVSASSISRSSPNH